MVGVEGAKGLRDMSVIKSAIAGHAVWDSASSDSSHSAVFAPIGIHQLQESAD
jgi:hypothetical protein